MIWDYSTPGIPEEMFERGSVPLTKTEVRTVALSKLKLCEDSRVLDIGCGTGSITVEAALQCPLGHVTALDINEEAVRLTGINARKFELSNVEVICGPAPEALPDKIFDRIFIGGGSSRMEEIVSYARAHLSEGGILAADTILLDSAVKFLKSLEENSFHDIECICLNISRGERVSTGWMMKAMNPIYIIRAHKKSGVDING